MSVQVQSYPVCILALISYCSRATKLIEKPIRNQIILLSHCGKHSGCMVLTNNVMMNVQRYLITSPVPVVANSKPSSVSTYAMTFMYQVVC